MSRAIIVALSLIVIYVIFAALYSFFRTEGRLVLDSPPAPESVELSDDRLCLDKVEYQNYVETCSSYFRNYSTISPRYEQAQNLVSVFERENKILMDKYNELLRQVYLCSEYRMPNCPSDYTTTFLQCTGSMRPTFDCTFPAKIYKPRSDELKVCDVIIFNDRIRNITPFHRIVGINGSRFITKGDATINKDPYQPTFEDITAKACYT